MLLTSEGTESSALLFFGVFFSHWLSQLYSITGYIRN